MSEASIEFMRIGLGVLQRSQSFNSLDFLEGAGSQNAKRIPFPYLISPDLSSVDDSSKRGNSVVGCAGALLALQRVAMHAICTCGYEPRLRVFVVCVIVQVTCPDHARRGVAVHEVGFDAGPYPPFGHLFLTTVVTAVSSFLNRT